MSETLGKWFPLNLDNSLHICEGKNRSRVGSKSKQQDPSAFSKHEITKKALSEPLTLEDLDLRLRMVESILIGGRKK